MKAQAVTEHGNVSSHAPHEKFCLKHNVKPIFGLEAYTGPADMRETGNTRKWHLTLLAADQTGYHNLMQIVTRSWAEGFYRWPTVSGDMLAEHNEGLIVLSGCADSKLACDLLGGKGNDAPSERAARRTIERFKDLLGDRFYLETQMFPELKRSHAINQWYAQEGQRYGIPLVATADVHYPHPDDNEMQLILHAAGRGAGTVSKQAEGWEYDIRLTHPTSDKLVMQRLMGTGLSKLAAQQALYSTQEIAARCNVKLPKAERLRFPLPDGYTSSKKLIWDWLKQGWDYRARFNNRLKKQRAKYLERLRYEMSIISEKGFIDYFLMLSELVRWAKDDGNGHPIPVGPARGSAAASLTCYLLRITEVDPLQFPMMYFERFIALDRMDVPDVDLDFADHRRDELTQHAIQVYGADRVGAIGTYTLYKGKNSLVDVARVNAVPDYHVKVIKDLMIERSSGDARAGATLEDTVAMFPQAKEVMDAYPVLWKALRLEGNTKGMSVHACGLVVADSSLTDVCATYERETGSGKAKRKRQVLSVNKYDAEYLNLMKVDFLGLSTLGMIEHALKMIGKTLEDMYDVPLDDPKIIAAFADGDLTGIFQFGGGATRIVCGGVKPDTFMELADINALSRPGPLHSGSTERYIWTKHRKIKPEKIHRALVDIIGWTKGQIIYQEQILAIVRLIGGFDWTHAQEIRKIISLKHGNAAFNMRQGLFLEGAKRLHGMKEAEAKEIWARMATAGTYAFNVAHSVSYAMLAYWTMWLKVYHPIEFFTACLLKYPDDEYFLLRDAIKHGVRIAAPSLKRSQETWGIRNGRIGAGFSQLPGLGLWHAGNIVRDRAENGPFEDWSSLLRVKGIGPAKLTAVLAKAGTDDPFSIHAVDRKLQAVRKAIDSRAIMLPKPTHNGAQIEALGRDTKVVYACVPTLRDSRDVVEDQRGQTGEDYEVIRARMKRPDLVKRMVIHALDETDTIIYLRWNRFIFPAFEKALWDLNMDRDVLLVRGKYDATRFGASVYVEDVWVIDPT
jgi:DNA polymerase-3 subunit alpha